VTSNGVSIRFGTHAQKGVRVTLLAGFTQQGKSCRAKSRNGKALSLTTGQNRSRCYLANPNVGNPAFQWLK
jgi:hypothetical protein